MKKTMNKKALAKEATYWNVMKQAVKQNPGTVCHK
jgi:hypothetical protein